MICFYAAVGTLLFGLTFTAVNCMPPLQAMPNTVKLIGEGGANITQFRVNTPICCPSRSTMLTGRFEHNNRVRPCSTTCTSPYPYQWCGPLCPMCPLSAVFTMPAMCFHTGVFATSTLTCLYGPGRLVRACVCVNARRAFTRCLLAIRGACG